jgi:hypothetical protein
VKIIPLQTPKGWQKLIFAKLFVNLWITHIVTLLMRTASVSSHTDFEHSNSVLITCYCVMNYSQIQTTLKLQQLRNPVVPRKVVCFNIPHKAAMQLWTLLHYHLTVQLGMTPLPSSLTQQLTRLSSLRNWWVEDSGPHWLFGWFIHGFIKACISLRKVKAVFAAHWQTLV